MPPEDQIWLLFKVSTKQRLKQMQKGLLYMNSLDYFSSLIAEGTMDTRADSFENVQGVLRAGPTKDGYCKLAITLGHQQFELGSKAIITAKYQNTKNIMLFCMGCIARGPNGTIVGEKNDEVVFDKRLREFGDHVLIIKNSFEFSKRYAKALKIRKGIYKPQHLHKGFGSIEYTNMYSFSGAKGIYKKDIRFEWQREFRLAIGAEDHALNSNGALELRIGNIADISDITPIDALIEKPIKTKRTPVKQIGNKWFALQRANKKN